MKSLLVSHFTATSCLGRGLDATLQALREQRGDVNPRGLFDLDRKPRRVGLAYKRLIEGWREVLPTQSWCLQVPLAA